MKRRIVTIDGYVDVSHQVFKNISIKNFELCKLGWKEGIRKEEINPHGTAVCGIIAKKNLQAEIINFDIYNKNNRIQSEHLLNALEYIYKNIECDVINMSLGTRINNKKLYELCKKLYDKGVIIVSAFDNAGGISYPAEYEFVIGVDISPRIKRSDEFVWVENSPVNIRGMGGVQRVPWSNNTYIINQGSSFVAPHIVAYIIKLMENGVSNEDIKKTLKENSVYKYNFKLEGDSEQEVEKNIKNVALFPYNKEMHALVNFPELLNFKIKKIYDIKYSNHIGNEVGIKRKYIIENIDTCDWNSFDTMILGHLTELEAVLNINLKEKIVEKCLYNNINVYSYDNYNLRNYENKFKKRGIWIEVQGGECNRKINKFGKMYSIKAPVLGVFGTSKKQGKYTVQLILRKKFLKAGYKIGQIGTEPNSLLLGMDEIYPFGYNGIANKDCYNIIEEVNYLIHRIDNKNPDIILGGSQSGTIPRAYNNIAQIPIVQNAFLLGLNPDAVILNVNIDDHVDYIKRTIMAIEGMGRCKVIAIVAYPFVYKNGWGIIREKKEKINEMEAKKISLIMEENLRRKVFILGNKRQEEELFQICVDFFIGGNKWKILDS